MSDAYIGEIRYFGFDFAPRFWALCAGQQLSIAQNQALFSILGTTYGGNGTTTFGLPDLRGRTIMNWGQGPGLTNRQLGELGGTENVTLSVNQMPQHTHATTFTPTAPSPTFNAATSKASLGTPSAGAMLARAIDDSPNAGAQVRIYAPAGTTPTAPLGVNVAGNVNVATAGNSTAFSNLAPYLTINASICLSGFFPSRN